MLDAGVLEHALVHCHPLTNDRTLTLASRDLVRFLEDSGHAPAIVEL